MTDKAQVMQTVGQINTKQKISKCEISRTKCIIDNVTDDRDTKGAYKQTSAEYNYEDDDCESGLWESRWFLRRYVQFGHCDLWVTMTLVDVTVFLSISMITA